MRHPSVTTAEKQAQLNAAGEEWPVGVDGLPKVWNPSGRYPAGGSWQLRSTHNRRCRSTSRTFAATPRGRGLAREGYRRRAGWFDEGGMATDEEFAAVNETLGSINSRTKETA